MSLTDKQKAFVYASTVLDELEKAGAAYTSLRIYADASCSLIIPPGTNENIRELASNLLFSADWVVEDIFYLRLDSKHGLKLGAEAMEPDNA